MNNNNSPQQQPQQEKAPLNWVPVIMFTVTTLVSVTLVPWYGIAYGYETSAWVACIIITWMTGMAITGGYHRLWSHNAYQAHWALRLWYALWGAMAFQNSILSWSSGHRVHHRYCDDVDLDPYSAKRGLWFSHMGWMLRKYKSGEVNFDNVKNLMKDPIVVWQHKYYVAIAMGMNIGVPVLLGLLTDDLVGMLLLAGFLRIVIAHHITFFITNTAVLFSGNSFSCFDPKEFLIKTLVSLYLPSFYISAIRNCYVIFLQNHDVLFIMTAGPDDDVTNFTGSAGCHFCWLFT